MNRIKILSDDDVLIWHYHEFVNLVSRSKYIQFSSLFIIIRMRAQYVLLWLGNVGYVFCNEYNFVSIF